MYLIFAQLASRSGVKVDPSEEASEAAQLASVVNVTLVESVASVVVAQQLS